MRVRSMVAGAALALTAIFSGGFADAAAITLNFNTDGVLPGAEVAAIDSSTISRTVDGTFGGTDSVAGGLWTFNQNQGTPNSKGAVYYSGNDSTLATSVANTPLGINVRLRMLKSVTNTDEIYFSMRGPDGILFMYFNYDSTTGVSQIGGRNSAGSKLMQNLPTGTLADFHNYAITWNPAVGGSFPAQLSVDGVFLGNTYAFLGAPSTLGYIEFGDALNGSNGENPLAEVDFLRFGTDLTVLAVPEPTGACVLLIGGLLGLRRRRASF